MRLNLLFHLDLLISPLLVEDLGLDTTKLACLLCALLGLTSFLLAPAFLPIKLATVQFTVPLNVFVLWHLGVA